MAKLIGVGVAVWKARAEDGWHAEELEALKEALDTFEHFGEKLGSDPAARPLIEQHCQLVTVAFGEAWRRHWHDDERLAPVRLKSSWRDRFRPRALRERIQQVERALKDAKLERALADRRTVGLTRWSSGSRAGGPSRPSRIRCSMRSRTSACFRSLPSPCLSGADLESAKLNGTNLSGTDLSDADFGDDDIAGALASAVGSSRTSLPDAVERPAHWPDFAEDSPPGAAAPVDEATT
ncbi:MAG: pentapeptide repeat-containing protein [Polyangiaceae bacterium]